MIKELLYPFDPNYILENKRKIKKDMNIYKKKCYAYIMDRKNSFDIDDEFDIKIVEAILCKRK